MFDYHEEDAGSEELSPLMHAIVPRLALCRIREYDPEDLDACVEVYRSNEPDLLPGGGLDAFTAFLEGGTSYMLVIEHSGDVIGFGGLELVGDSDTALLRHGMIHREYQRRGFGTTLLAARIALLETDERPLELWMGAPPSAVPFYGRFGFKLERVHPGATGGGVGHSAMFSLMIEPQDILDVRDALEEREIQIELNEETDAEEETDEE